MNNINAFTIIDNKPLLVGEYLSHVKLQQIDSSVIGTSINITKNKQKTVFNISIDNRDNIISNQSKYISLIDLISNNVDKLSKNFDVLRRDVAVKLNYQIENSMNGKIYRNDFIRFSIKNRGYFTEVGNDINILENSLITHLNDIYMMTVNTPLHMNSCSGGLVIRLLSLDIMYPTLLNSPPIKKDDCDISNKYYNWSEDLNNISLHSEEINHPFNNPKWVIIKHIPFESNNLVDVVYGTSVMFKITIWDNDIILVDNTNEIANLMGIRYSKGIVERLDELDTHIDRISNENVVRDLEIQNILERLNNDVITEDDLESLLDDYMDRKFRLYFNAAMDELIP